MREVVPPPARTAVAGSFYVLSEPFAKTRVPVCIVIRTYVG